VELFLRTGNREVSITIDTAGGKTTVRIDGNPTVVEEFFIGTRYVSFRIGTNEYRLTHARDGHKLHIGHGGVDYAFSLADGDDDNDEEASDGFSSEIVSPMPGKVLDVVVAIGDLVEAGAALLVLEAMKMEQTIRAPAAARVTAINVDGGAMVGPGQILLTLEPQRPYIGVDRE